MPQELTTPLLLILMVVAFYFLMIRPQQKRARAQRETLSTLAPGTRVLLANGFYATVVSVQERTVEVELAPGLRSHVVKQAVAQVVSGELDPASPVTAEPTVPISDADPLDAPASGSASSPLDEAGPDGPRRTDS